MIQSLVEKIDWKKVNGLIPAIIQNQRSSQVLMLGYMNQEALAKTLANKRVTFFSRTKQKLWTKGETSGNVLNLHSVCLDCDQDTLLVQVHPVGPTCHTNATSCLNDGNNSHDFSFLKKLEEVIAGRHHDNPKKSYTAELLNHGTKKIAQKVGEEGIEVALAAMAKDRAELTNESADLLFHLLVLLEKEQLPFSDVVECLRLRHQS